MIDKAMRGLVQLASSRGSKPRLSTLIFHRVVAEPDKLFPGEMHAQRFDAVCGWLKQWFNVLPLDEAVACLGEDRLPPRACAITFDDGYADNRDVALPILKRHGLNATVFVATGFLNGGRMWNDSVVESIRHTSKSECDLSGVVPELGVLSLGDFEAKRSAIQTILSSIKYFETSNRLKVANQISELIGLKGRDGLMMRDEQVRVLHRSGIVIGAHTVNHPILARLTREAAREEMAQSRSDLESLLGTRVGLFAYPNGKPGEDYSDETVGIAAELGFDAALTTSWGSASHRTDRFQIPRFTPWDQDQLRFGLRLAQNLWTD